MKWDWFRTGRQDDVQQDSRPFASPEGWVLGSSKSLAGSPLGAYVDQLVDEHYAERQDDRCVVRWDSVYCLVENDDHASSLYLLGLPAPTALLPSLAAHGSPGDGDFAIRLTGWFDATGDLPASAVARTGAVLSYRGRDELLSSAAFSLISMLLELHLQGPGWSSEERMVSAGRIQKAAHACGARLDTYLDKTSIVVADQLDITLKIEDALGTSVVEVLPRPQGAPDNLLDQFDRYDSVQTRYDLPQSDGQLTHVLLPPPVRETLEAVKRAPGRRYASKDADAFLHNPYPFLGDGAEAILPPERFEQARRAAGLVERELDAVPGEDGWDLLLIDPAGDAGDLCEKLTEPSRVQSLLAAAAEARQSGRPVFRWKNHLLQLSNTTSVSLQQLGQWMATSAVSPVALQFGDIFDLGAYSDRVVGFDGKPIHVPQLVRGDAGKDMIPENMEALIATVDPLSGQVSSTHLDVERIQEFRQITEEARQQGTPSVAVPGTKFEIPTSEAIVWLNGMNDVLRKQVGAPGAPKDPKPRATTSLRILHNIEQLEYGTQSSLAPPPLDAPQLPRALRREIALMPHQRDGLAWMQHRFQQRDQGVRGILLADDMGLGKTLQCLCVMAWYREITPMPKPCLIVAPVSLLENWKAEIGKFLDGSQGTTIALYGSELAKHRLLPAQLEPGLREAGIKKFLRPGFADGAAFVLTTYETLRDYELSLGREAWGVFACDEAQKIKTPGALVTRSAKAMQAEFKIACTGTPVENSLADLWCLFDFFQPGLLASLSEFTKSFRKAIEQREEGHEPLVEQLRAAIDPWVLRRMKSDVADLPDKIDETHPQADLKHKMLQMSVLQRQLYGRTIADFKQTMERAEDKGGPGTAALTLLHRLRMICANPLAANDERAELLPVEEHLRHSPKLGWLLEQLDHIRQADEKAIVFTEYRELQRLLQRAIAGRFNLQVDVVNGSTTVDPAHEASRQAVIDRFQARPGFGVIVLSTTAVGFGVNVQAANHVIHFTRPWNPAKEDQATDRAYRIGSTKPVWVYCPTVAGDGFESFEQRIAERLSRKRELSRDMLAPEQSVTWTDFEDLVS